MIKRILSVVCCLCCLSSAPSAAEYRSLDEMIELVLNAFEQQSDKMVNNLIHPDIGLYVVYRRGVMDQYEKIARLSFSSPVLSYLGYGSLSKQEIEKSLTTVHNNVSTNYNCETDSWDRAGVSISQLGASVMLSGIALLNRDNYKITAKEIKKLKRLEAVSRRIVAAPTRRYALVFHLSYIDDNWYLTLLDQVSDDCSA